MDRLHLFDPDGRPLSDHEHNAILKRLKQIAVALGRPTLTSEQLEALVEERWALVSKLEAIEPE